MQNSHRMDLSNKKRIVIKIGSTSLTHPETGAVNLGKIEQLARQISDLKGRGKEVVLVTSGAVAAGKQTFGKKGKLASLAEKQACAAVGQAKLMMVYQRLFAEYSMTAAQILLTRFTMQDEEARSNAHNTFDELLKMGAVPIVNENDTVSTYEIRFGREVHLCRGECDSVPSPHGQGECLRYRQRRHVHQAEGSADRLQERCGHDHRQRCGHVSDRKDHRRGGDRNAVRGKPHRRF